MKKTVWLVGGCVLGALNGCAAGNAYGNSTLSPDEALQSLQIYAGDMMSHVAKGDFSRVKESASDDAVVYDMGDDGKPVIARGKAEVVELLNDYQKMMTESGATSTSSITGLDCRVDAGPGYCLIEFNQTMTVGGQTMGPLKYRATLIVRPEGNSWMWTHWHASSRELLTPVVPSPAPPPPVGIVADPDADADATPAATPAPAPAHKP